MRDFFFFFLLFSPIAPSVFPQMANYAAELVGVLMHSWVYIGTDPL